MAVRRRIGYLPENPPLYPDMTVQEFLQFVAKIKGVSRRNRKNKVAFAIERCQLTEKTQTVIRKLSKGYRQRVGIAQAIVHEPPVIILDEPTVGLDPRQITEVRNLIKSLAGEHTIILSTHILPEVSMTCDRVVIINRGEVVATNTPIELIDSLGSGYDYHVELEGDLANILPLLEAISGINSIKQQNQDSRVILEINCHSGAEPGKDIANIIVNQGLSLYEMRRSSPSLEDVFLELTTEESLNN
nr:ATP-binding cassette domain-containing protein [Xenococcaceae cyanobacterium MO_188.B19]